MQLVSLSHLTCENGATQRDVACGTHESGDFTGGSRSRVENTRLSIVATTLEVSMGVRDRSINIPRFSSFSCHRICMYKT